MPSGFVGLAGIQGTRDDRHIVRRAEGVSIILFAEYLYYFG